MVYLCKIVNKFNESYFNFKYFEFVMKRVFI